MNFAAQGHGIEGLGSLQALRPLHRSGYSDSAQGDRRVGRRLGQVQVVVPAYRQLELHDAEDLGEGDGGSAQRDLQRRRHPQLGKRSPSRPGRVRRRARAQGVGGPGGARSSHHVRLPATWRERSQAHSVQVSSLVSQRSDLVFAF